MALQTDRLILRQPKYEDKDDIHEMLNDEIVLKYNCLEKASLDDVHKLITRHNSDRHFFVIELKDTNKVIGQISIEPDQLRFEANSMCLSYYLNTNYTKKGYMTEALKEIIRYCFDDFKLDCVSCRIFSPNQSSINLIKRLGFIQEGHLRKAVKGYKGIIYDDLLFSIIKEDYN